MLTICGSGLPNFRSLTTLPTLITTLSTGREDICDGNCGIIPQNDVTLSAIMERMKDNKSIIAHLSMFGACAGWGLMAPVGKDAMSHGVSGLSMVTFRVVGACLLFLVAQ